jgi:hypothetical protein
MNEEEWLTCAEPMRMLEFLRGKASDRKLRLFCVACFPLARSYDPDDGTRLLNGPTIEFVMRFADGLASVEEMRSVWRARGFAATVPSPEHPFEWAVGFLQRAEREEALGAQPQRFPTRQELIAPFRDIFGNPFRQPNFDSAWRTDTALSLARQMYESREFGAMPILADALQDAGCDNDDVLNHCRGSGPHVRGCWVVDLLTGRK